MNQAKQFISKAFAWQKHENKNILLKAKHCEERHYPEPLSSIAWFSRPLGCRHLILTILFSKYFDEKSQNS